MQTSFKKAGCYCQVASVVSHSVRPQRRQPTRLPCPWDSPGKNTGVGCHFLLQCMKVKSESEDAQSYLNLSDPMDCSLPGSSVQGIFQARVLEWGVIAFSEVQSRSQQIDQSKGRSQKIRAEYQFQVSQSVQSTDLEYANQSNIHARS